MTATTQAKQEANAFDWGFWGFAAGTAIAAGVTASGGGPITAWICTKCLWTGISAGAAAGGFKAAKDVHNATAKKSQKAAIILARKIELAAQAMLYGAIASLGTTLSSLNYSTIGYDCKAKDQSGYCTASEHLFYLTSFVSAIAMIAVIYTGYKYSTVSAP